MPLRARSESVPSFLTRLIALILLPGLTGWPAWDSHPISSHDISDRRGSLPLQWLSIQALAGRPAAATPLMGHNPGSFSEAIRATHQASAGPASSFELIDHSLISTPLAWASLATLSTVLILHSVDPLPLIHFAVMTRRIWLAGTGLVIGAGGFSWRQWNNNYRPEEPNRPLPDGKPAGSITEFSDGKILRLSDGRNLGFAERGAAENTPGLIRLIFLPGGMESRLMEYLRMDDILIRAKVRMYIIEPPEDGLSSPHPNSVLADWVADIDEFAARIFEGKEFSIAGHSAGGFVARCFAMSAKAPGLKVVAMANSPGPMYSPVDWFSYPIGGVLAFLAAKFAGPYALKKTEDLRKRIFNWPAYIKDLIESPETPEADKEVLSDPWISEMFRKSRQGSFRQGPQAIDEQIRTITSPMPRQINDLSQYIWLVFHGVNDPVVPIQIAREFAKSLQNVVTFFFPRMGHHWIRKHFDYFIAKVAQAHNGTRPEFTPLEPVFEFGAAKPAEPAPLVPAEERPLKHAA